MADAHRSIVNSKVACTQKYGIHCKHCNPKQKSINTRKRDRKLNNSRARRKLKEEIDNEWFNYIHFYEIRYGRQELNEYITTKSTNLDPEYNDIVNKNFWDLF